MTLDLELPLTSRPVEIYLIKDCIEWFSPRATNIPTFRSLTNLTHLAGPNCVIWDVCKAICWSCWFRPYKLKHSDSLVGNILVYILSDLLQTCFLSAFTESWLFVRAIYCTMRLVLQVIEPIQESECHTVNSKVCFFRLRELVPLVYLEVRII